jgi:hypothetical protein
VPGGAGNILAIDLETIDLPLLLRARIPVGSLGLLVAAGGAPAVRVSCNFEVQQSAVPMNRTPCSDAQVSSVADFSTWDILAVAGAGVGIPIAGSELALTFRMSRGFIPVIESQELYNQSWSVILSLPF